MFLCNDKLFAFLKNNIFLGKFLGSFVPKICKDLQAPESYRFHNLSQECFIE